MTTATEPASILTIDDLMEKATALERRLSAREAEGVVEEGRLPGEPVTTELLAETVYRLRARLIGLERTLDAREES